MARQVNEDTLGAALTVINAAFDHDPLWQWAMGSDGAGARARKSLWAIILDGARPHRMSWISEAGDAVAVWLPPGVPEWEEGGDEALADVVTRLVPDRSNRVRAVFDALAQEHPPQSAQGPAYLSLLAVHPDAQGRGRGTALLAETLSEIDRRGWSAYLESSAERNVGLYRRHGFEIVARVTPMGSPPITAMARPARPTSSSAPAR